MNKSELTAKMLEWEKAKIALDALEDEIKASVMQMEESFDAGNVHARFSGGRRTFDYKAAGENGAPDEVIAQFTETKTITSTDWKKVCERANIADIPFTIGNPSVSLSIK